MKRFLSSLLALLLAGCISITIDVPASPTKTPAITTNGGGATTITPTPVQPALGPTATATPAGLTMPTPTIDLTLTPPPDSAPRALYFLSQSGVWVLRPNTEKAVRLTAEDVVVTAFDVWPEDGRLAFATKSGKLYLQMHGKDPQIFFKLEDTPYPAFVNGIDWSPDGSQLAYTVDYDSGGEAIYLGYPSSPSGVWITPIQGGRPTWMMSNTYPASKEKITEGRRFSAPQWSPDGQGLIIHASYWEWSNTHWIYPLEYAEDGSNLHTLDLKDPSGNAGANWGHATWTTDGQGLVFSSQGDNTYGDLAYASRDGSQAGLWQSGRLGSMYIADAHMIPTGSFMPGSTAGITLGPGRMVYIASFPESSYPFASMLFVMKSPLVDPSINGSIFLSDGMCLRKDAYGNHNYARSIEWNPDFSLGVVTCGSNEIYLLNMHRGIPTQTDLLPALPPLAEQSVPAFRWGEVGR